MKVLFVAFKYDYGIKERGESLEIKGFYPALMNTGNEIISFWLEDNGYPKDLKKLQENLMLFADEVKPDLVFFILMKDEIHISTIKSLGAKYKTVNWFCDDQWRFNNFSKRIAPIFTYIITVDKYSMAKYKEIGCANVIKSQWAALEYNKDLDLRNTNYKYQISFIGAKNLTREWIVKELRQRNIYVECFGSGWPNGKISYSEMTDIFRYSKINLNLSNSVSKDLRFVKYFVLKSFSIFLEIFRRPLKFHRIIYSYLSQFKFLFFSDKNVEQIKARNFEIPGYGGFQLSQFSLEIEDYYDVGKEIALFGNIDELDRQIVYYLNSDLERELIRSNGYLRTASHTYDQRLKSFFAHLKTQ